MKEKISKLLEQGKTRQQIASILGISLKATQSIIDRMKKKDTANK